MDAFTLLENKLIGYVFVEFNIKLIWNKKG